MIKKIIFFLLIFTCLMRPIFAMDFREPDQQTHYDPSLWYQEELYIDRLFGKLIHGTWNFIFGPFELIREPYEAYAIGDNLLLGLGRGVYYAVADTVGGALNAVTAPITPLRIPLPQGGVEGRRF